jgi:hypothetical protein
MNIIIRLWSVFLLLTALTSDSLDLAIKSNDIYEHKQAESSLARFEALLKCRTDYSGSLLNTRRLNSTHMQWIQENVVALTLSGLTEAPVKFHRDIYHDTSLRVYFCVECFLLTFFVGES